MNDLALIVLAVLVWGFNLVVLALIVFSLVLDSYRRKKLYGSYL